jgi:hypothetical protein
MTQIKVHLQEIDYSTFGFMTRKGFCKLRALKKADLNYAKLAFIHHPFVHVK